MKKTLIALFAMMAICMSTMTAQASPHDDGRGHHEPDFHHEYFAPPPSHHHYGYNHGSFFGAISLSDNCNCCSNCCNNCYSSTGCCNNRSSNFMLGIGL